MHSFPAELSGLLHRQPANGPDQPLGTRGEFVRWFPRPVAAGTVAKCLQLLETHMGPHMQRWHRPIPPQLIPKLRRNYTEVLPKTLRNDSALLNHPRSKATVAARQIGLVQMLTSTSLHRFAEIQSGYLLERRPGLQVLRYRNGDYVGPHNDHHPEDWNLKNGYVDLHITLTNPYVKNQYLIHEKDGLLNGYVDVSVPSGIAVSRLPYWHQVTPLVAAKNKEQLAARWLLLVSFNIANGK